jgi:hypothetical protein
MMSIGVMPDGEEEADRIFKGLSAGARAVTEMADYP